MLNLPPLAQTFVFATLIIGYFITFLFQKNKIDILKTTVTALKELTDGQKNHITTYKEIVSLDAIKENIEIQKEVTFKKTSDRLGDFFWGTNTEPLLDRVKEFCIFMGHLYFDKDFNLGNRFDENERNKVIKTFFPKNDYFLEQWFVECRKIFDVQRGPTQ